MSGGAKTVGAWAVKLPNSGLLYDTIRSRASSARDAAAASYFSHPVTVADGRWSGGWKSALKRGWRVVRVTITEASK